MVSPPYLCDSQGTWSDAGLDVSLGMFRETIAQGLNKGYEI